MIDLNRILPGSVLSVCLKWGKRGAHMSLAEKGCLKTKFGTDLSLRYKYDDDIEQQNHMPRCPLKKASEMSGGGYNRLRSLNYYGNGIRSPCFS